MRPKNLKGYLSVDKYPIEEWLRVLATELPCAESGVPNEILYFKVQTEDREHFDIKVVFSTKQHSLMEVLAGPNLSGGDLEGLKTTFEKYVKALDRV